MQINYLILILAEKGTNLFSFKRQALAKKILRERETETETETERHKETQRETEREQKVSF